MKYILIATSLLFSLSTFAAYPGRNVDIVTAKKCNSSEDIMGYPGHLKLRSMAKEKIRQKCEEIGAKAKDIDMYLLGVAENETETEQCRSHAYEVTFFCK